MGRSLLVALAALVWLSACADEAAPLRTQVLLHVDADDALRTRTEVVQVVVRSRTGSDRATRRTQTVRVAGDDAEASFPLTIPLAPLDEDASRGWEVEVTALEGGEPMARVRAVGAYVAGERREAWISLESPCLGMLACGEDETCFEGRCEPACVITNPEGTGEPARPVPCPGECTTCEGADCAPVDDGTPCGAGTCWAGRCCSGCWDGERCVDGDDLASCGSRGDLCVSCDCEGDRCLAGACVPIRPAHAVTAGERHSCVTTDGIFLYCWGDDTYGQLGVAEVVERSTEPVRVPGSGWQRIEAGFYFTCGLVGESLDMRCWGRNNRGQIGIGSSEPFFDTPQSVLYDRSAMTVADDFACATEPGVEGLSCWGSNADGQIGQGTLTPTSYPTPTAIDVPGVTFAQLSGGSDHLCVLDDAGDLWCWGVGVSGQLGFALEPGVQHALTPTRLEAGGGWDLLRTGYWHTCALRDGELWCWGAGLNCQNAQPHCGSMDASSNQLVPARVGDAADWVALDSGRNHGCGIRGDAADPAGQTLWCWGSNQHGKAAAEGSHARLPSRVPGLGWIAVGTGGQHTCAIRRSGSVWCWGDDEHGQLGLGPDGPAETATPSRVCIPEP